MQLLMSMMFVLLLYTSNCTSQVVQDLTLDLIPENLNKYQNKSVCTFECCVQLTGIKRWPLSSLIKHAMY